MKAATLILDITFVVLLWVIAEEDMRTRVIPVYKTMSVSSLAILRVLLADGDVLVMTTGAVTAILIYFFSACPATVPAGKRMGGADYRVLAGLLLYYGVDALLIVATGHLFFPIIVRHTEPVIETEEGRYLIRDICEKQSVSKTKNPNNASFPYTVIMAAGTTLLYVLTALANIGKDFA